MNWVIALLVVVVLVLFSKRYGWWRPSVAATMPRILMYHMVSESRPGAAFNKLRVSPEKFEKQVKWLADKGYHFAFMSELAQPEKLPLNTVAITFDDGYEDNFLNAHPVLAKYGARATLYLVEDRFDRDWSVYKKSHHNTGELKREHKLSDVQVEDMLDSGLWELGGHTATHANLSALEPEEKLQEIQGSKHRLEEKFHTRLSSFAYPFGIFGDQDVSLVREAGYDTAVTTVEGIDPVIADARYVLKRIKISGKDNSLAFAIRLRTGKR
jgi:peptidoglycan/xylan/chitin deacetylase (PgdA/CDA1 family)